MHAASSPGRLVALTVAVAAATLAAPAAAQTVHARLTGFQEVPAASSPGSGQFTAKIDPRAGTIIYELEYNGLQGQVTQAHIHLGQHGVSGGISVWLCGTAAAPGPAGTSTCPAGNSGAVNGVLMAANVVGPANQLIEAGQFDELIKAIRAGLTYANVHSSVLPLGEIRGQIGGRGHESEHR